MRRFEGEDDPLQKAFRLAYFIHPDKELALRVVAHALCRLDVSVSKQNKRRYYPLTGHWLSKGLKVTARSKVSLEKYQRLQLLIYYESESYEKCQEPTYNALTEEDFIIRFIKHLVLITVERSSFYVMLGLSRLLHTYTTREAAQIYDFVMQESERVKEEDYYRKQKGILMGEIQKRFGNLLKICCVQRGEKRFETQENSRQYVELVNDCLDMFTLWYTSCVLPERSDEMKDNIGPLRFKDADPDAEYSIEIKRIHTLIHPKCFSRVIAYLRLTSPQDSLAIPMFFHTNGKPPRADRRNPPTLQEEDFATLRSVRTRQAARRKNFFDGSLSILVDGIERVRLNTLTLRHVQFEVTDQDRLIEVKTSDEAGDLLLASHMIIHREIQSGKPPQRYSVVLEGGQELSFSLQASLDSEGEFAGAVVELTYRETNLLRRTLLLIQHIQRETPKRLVSTHPSGVLKALLALVFLVACAASVITYVNFKRQPSPISASHNSANENKESSVPSYPSVSRSDQSMVAPSKGKSATRSKKVYQQSSGAVVTKNSSTQPASPDKAVASDANSSTGSIELPLEGRLVQEGTRGVIVGSRDALRLIKQVYVESLGSDLASQRLRDRLIRSIQANNRLTITEEPEDADAVLRWSVSKTRMGRQIKAQLINTRQETLWSATQQIPSKTTPAPLLEYAGKIIEQLLKDIEAMEKQ